MAKKKILVVDDDVELLSIMKLDLAFDSVFEVIACADPFSALEKVITDDIALVLTDFHMPGMNGGELLENIRIKKPGLPVFLFSIYYDDEAIPKHVRDKVDAIVSKPIEHEKLKNLILKTLQV
ncbi:MAG: response regulator [Candidatus Saganbacteria bacterium]|nr:response regulator [Candidatus Saganbacteria bacterium]